jgi:plastocyanin
MRKLTSILAVAALLAAVGAVSAFGAAKTATVKWHVPTNATVNIAKGGSVKWVWTDGLPHNVSGPGFKSKTVAKNGFTYSHVFKTKGSFKIICQVHPTTMKTTVKVA